MSVEILPATADRFDDAGRALTGGGDGPSCQCQWWTISAAEFRDSTREQRAEMLRTEMTADPLPGLIAYADGDAAGWVRVGPRTDQPRLLRTRVVRAHSPEPLDDPSRSDEHTSELQSLMRISYAVFSIKKQQHS